MTITQRHNKKPYVSPWIHVKNVDLRRSMLAGSYVTAHGLNTMRLECDDPIFGDNEFKVYEGEIQFFQEGGTWGAEWK